MTELLTLKNVTKKYKTKTALDDFTYKFTKGKIYGLLGHNGAGKTTLIKLINDLLVPTSGEILIKGHHPGVESKLAISYLPERTYLDKQLTVDEVLDFFADFYENFDRKKAEKLLKDLKLDRTQKIAKMSKGMQEKVQIALVMSRRADLYILDEPLGGVDPATRDYILHTILTNFDDRASMIISTHMIGDIERILDEVIFMSEGKIAMSGSADQLRKEYHSSIDEIFRDKFKF